MNREKAEFFDGQVGAAWAAGEYGELERPRLERMLKEGELGPGMAVLEPGCGTGRLTAVLARAVSPGGRVAALDISHAMVRACREKAGGLPGVEVRREALEDHLAGPAAYDRIVCHQVFPHFDDQPRALDLMAGMLKPGGLLLIVHFINAREINDTHRKAGTVVETDLLPGPAEMARLLEEAGFELLKLADDELGYFLSARR